MLARRLATSAGLFRIVKDHGRVAVALAAFNRMLTIRRTLRADGLASSPGILVNCVTLFRSHKIQLSKPVSSALVLF